jgi:hypothetical protein
MARNLTLAIARDEVLRHTSHDVWKSDLACSELMLQIASVQQPWLCKAGIRNICIATAFRCVLQAQLSCSGLHTSELREMRLWKGMGSQRAFGVRTVAHSPLHQESPCSMFRLLGNPCCRESGRSEIRGTRQEDRAMNTMFPPTDRATGVDTESSDQYDCSYRG